tara:strand:+ start:107 stop:748 length:642 start_codon:yes stop_codon:yes gene_type:complete
MAKSSKTISKCPPGAFCIETYTLFFMIILIAIMFYLIYQHCTLNTIQKHTVSSSNTASLNSSPSFIHHHNNMSPHLHYMDKPQSSYDLLRPIMDPGISYNETPNDTLMNPYSPPLQYNQPHKYRQIGYLKNETNTSKMFPIFAKPIHTRRDKWYYYTIYDNIKLPIYSNGRKCSSEHGCDSLMNGDQVFLENMNESYHVYLYDNHTLTYDPSI